MLKQIVEYKDFDGIPQRDELWFHLTKASLMLTEKQIFDEVIDLSHKLREKLPLFEEMNGKEVTEETFMTKEGDVYLEAARIMTQMLDKIVDLAYGVRTGNDRFDRSPKVISEFKTTLAYETFIISLISNPAELLTFIETLTQQINK